MAYKRDSDARACDEKVDVWACGVLLYEVCYGRAPFAADTPKLTCENILRGFDGDFPQPVRPDDLAACFLLVARHADVCAFSETADATQMRHTLTQGLCARGGPHNDGA